MVAKKAVDTEVSAVMAKVESKTDAVVDRAAEIARLLKPGAAAATMAKVNKAEVVVWV